MSAPTQTQQPTKAVADPRAQAAAQLDRSIAFGESGMQITNLEQAARFAVWARESGLTSARNAAEVVIQLQIGAELGFSPMQSLSIVHVIEGKPSIAVEAQVAKVEAAGALQPGTKIMYRFEGEGEDLACIVWSFPNGGERVESPPIYLREFKHLTSNPKKQNWINYPKRMLSARAKGFHCRDFYAAHVRNLLTTEEVMDLDAARGATAAERVINPPPSEPDPLLEAAREPEDAQVVCAHPDGFGVTEGRADRHCIHCGVSEDE